MENEEGHLLWSVDQKPQAVPAITHNAHLGRVQILLDPSSVLAPSSDARSP